MSVNSSTKKTFNVLEDLVVFNALATQNERKDTFTTKCFNLNMIRTREK